MTDAPHIPLDFSPISEQMGLDRINQFAAHLTKRRTVREFSDAPINPLILQSALSAATSAPSGANKQPWHFSIIQSPDIKHQIREAAEAEERAFYETKATDAWLDDLKPLATDANKPFLEKAPALIAVFLERYSLDAQGNKAKNYYMPESVGIACGFLLAALHQAGLATLTHTPSPMGFLNQICQRPDNERAFMLIVTGYPAEHAQVPDIQRKSLSQTCSWF